MLHIQLLIVLIVKMLIVCLVFPAAILQPPFYHKHFPKALNYGGIGVVIGHEITHGFDDKGRQFDHLGNIKQWWDLASFQKFRERKRCIIGQLGKMQNMKKNNKLESFCAHRAIQQVRGGGGGDISQRRKHPRREYSGQRRNQTSILCKKFKGNKSSSDTMLHCYC